MCITWHSREDLLSIITCDHVLTWTNTVSINLTTAKLSNIIAATREDSFGRGKEKFNFFFLSPRKKSLDCLHGRCLIVSRRSYEHTEESERGGNGRGRTCLVSRRRCLKYAPTACTRPAYVSYL